jgi:hypothetical protein
MLAHVLYHAQSWAQARIRCLAYLAEQAFFRPSEASTFVNTGRFWGLIHGWL